MPNSSDPLSAYTSVFTATLDGVLRALAAVALIAVLATAALLTLTALALRGPELWNALVARVSAPFVLLDARIESYRRARAPRALAAQFSERTTYLPHTLRGRRDALETLRARIDDGDVSEWSGQHQAVGTGREEGYRLVYEQPVCRIEDAINDAIARLGD